METDTVLTALHEERAALLASVAHVDQMIALRKAHLSGSSSIASKAKTKFIKGNDNPASSLVSSPIVTRTPTGKSDGIMKVTQQTAIEMLRAGREYVRTGEVMKATEGKGFKYPDVMPSKSASRYLKATPELENFALNAEKRQFAWRLKNIKESQGDAFDQRVAGARGRGRV